MKNNKQRVSKKRKRRKQKQRNVHRSSKITYVISKNTTLFIFFFIGFLFIFFLKLYFSSFSNYFFLFLRFEEYSFFFLRSFIFSPSHFLPFLISFIFREKILIHPYKKNIIVSLSVFIEKHPFSKEPMNIKKKDEKKQGQMFFFSFFRINFFF